MIRKVIRSEACGRAAQIFVCNIVSKGNPNVEHSDA